MKITKSIEHIKVYANIGKVEQLEEVAKEYKRYLQIVVWTAPLKVDTKLRKFFRN
jgi:hypothetical protein